MQPLVSIVTATWGRPQTILERCLPSVDCQVYRPIEHLIVLDGADPATQEVLREAAAPPDGIARRCVRLGRNWTAPFNNDSNGAIARMVGSYLARGDFICYLDDDNYLDPRHVAEMVDCLQREGVDIASSQFGHPGGLIGGGVSTGQVDASSFMHRAEILRHGSWQPDGYTCDGQVVERWVAAGCTWAMKPGATMTITSQRNGEPD